MRNEVKKPIYKKWWFWVIIILVIIVIGSNLNNDHETSSNDNESNVESPTKSEDNAKDTDNQTTKDNEIAKNEDQSEEETTENEEPVELSPREEMLFKIVDLIDSNKAFDSGSYIKGDIPAGEYAFVTFEGSGRYFVEKDEAGNIIDNENFDSFGYVYVHGVGNIKTDAVLISPNDFQELGVSSAKEIYEILNNKTDYNGAAWYKVGVDIPAGDYVIESIGEGYVAIMSGPVGDNKIVDNEIFNGRYAVSVSDGQYLKVSRATITQQ